MLNAFVWHLWCNRQLTMATVLNQKYVLTYLSLGEPAITPTTYLGAANHGMGLSKFCLPLSG
jgi:hypothetical protein